MRVVFLGTPAFAIAPLFALYDAGHEIVGVITQPDQPRGRHGTPVPCALKEAAMSRGLAVFSPERISKQAGIDLLRSLAPDVMVTAAYGQILSRVVLRIAPFGVINIHASLLPKYRGAAPVQWSIIHGESETGVTTMKTSLGIDTGDILLQERTAIGPEETYGQLLERLSPIGAKLIVETLTRLEHHTIVPQAQEEDLATHEPMLTKNHGRIDFSKSAQAVHDLVRGVNPWPGAFCYLDSSVLKIWRTDVTQGEGAAGEIVTASPKEGLVVACGQGALRILELQAPGGKRLPAEEYLRGKSLTVGHFLRSEEQG